MNATQPKERPILLNGEMVRAVQEKRKTQTRRPLVPQPGLRCTKCHCLTDQCECEFVDGEHAYRCTKNYTTDVQGCPFGQPGDLLWVRETWAGVEGEWHTWKATFNRNRLPDGMPPMGLQEPRWRPSIHMPRWAARIFLRVVDVRVERVQDISEADAIKEGWPYWRTCAACNGILDAAHLAPQLQRAHEKHPRPRQWFRETWDNIYSAKGYGWDADPFVWAVTFEQEQQHG